MSIQTNKIVINKDFSTGYIFDASGNFNVDGSIFQRGKEIKIPDTSSFLSLNDTPNSYAGFNNYVVAVNNDASALTFVGTAPLKISIPQDISAYGIADSSSFLRGDGSWATVIGGGSGSTPGGIDGNIQFNNNGDLGGTPLSYNTSTDSFLLGAVTPNNTKKINLSIDASIVNNASIFELNTTRQKGVYQYLEGDWEYGPDTLAKYFHFTDTYNGILNNVASISYLQSSEGIGSLHLAGEGSNGIHIGAIPASYEQYPYLRIFPGTKNGGTLHRTQLSECSISDTDISSPLVYRDLVRETKSGLIRLSPVKQFVNYTQSSSITISMIYNINVDVSGLVGNSTITIYDVIEGVQGYISLSKGNDPTQRTVNLVTSGRPTLIIKSDPSAYTGINNTAAYSKTLIRYIANSKNLFVEYLWL